ncbi:MAG: phosphoglucosamine mutase, partial [Spirochaetota bacterium]
RAAKFHAACDFVNGTGLVSTPLLMEKLGVKLTAVNNALTGTFAHMAEPSPATMQELSRLVKRTKADIGFIQDPDADRLALTDERGTILSEEYTLALSAEHIFSKKKTDAAVNLSTSRMIDDVAKKYRRTVFRTKIGEINVSETLRRKKLYFGGEGNGGIIIPSICPGRDSLLGMALLLEMMAVRGKRVSELVSELPAYRIIKDKVEAKGIDVDTLYSALKRTFSGAHFSEIDGIRADVDEGWVHVRTSNTEPVIRIIAEAKDELSARELIEKAMRVIR